MLANSTNPGSSKFHGANRALGLLDLLEIAWRRKWYVVGTVTLSIAMGAVFLCYTVPTYEVSARVLVQARTLPLEPGPGTPRDRDYLATQAEIISSPAIVKRAVNLTDEPVIVGDVRIDPVGLALRSLSVRPLVGTNVLRLAYRCQSPGHGIQMIDAIVDSYRDYLKEIDSDDRLETLQLVTRSEAEVRSELEERQKRYRELRKESPSIGYGKDITSTQKTNLEKLGQTLAEIRNRRIELENRINVMSEPLDSTDVAASPHQALIPVALFGASSGSDQSAVESTLVQRAVLKSSVADRRTNSALDWMAANVQLTGTPDSASIYRNLYQAEVRQRELAETYGPKHPEMRAVREEIAAWKERLESLNQEAQTALQREVAAVTSHEKRLSDLYDRELEEAKATDDYLLREQQELEGIQRLKTAHNSMLTQLSEWRLINPAGEEGPAGYKVMVLAAPTAGTAPVWPRPSILMAVCCAVGIAGGFALIGALEGVDGIKRRSSSEGR